ncbi:hypothetical protein JQC91_09135 [Jannaschia sp. Os4]|uniref:hypothetical protein n=1 Tax=Jannaschia sp. Os4 TaxID=2807617 RepID=UPI0019394007|nr:hypothetical protein [Jannaschia sp. Os4]MBM2576470.1 hypothetical protein [Jannaschia sp. Os4]
MSRHDHLPTYALGLGLGAVLSVLLLGGIHAADLGVGGPGSPVVVLMASMG